jgi:CheY-like chemotaxis protein
MATPEPAGKPSDAAQSRRPTPTHQGPKSRRRDKLGLSVLVVDDDPDDLELILAVLRPHLAVSEYQCATDGEEGLAVLEHSDFAPDLILLDLNMPRLGGLDLLAKARKLAKCAATPVIVLTTSGRMEDVRGALQRGASGYIIKPDRAKDLEERLDAVIHGVMKDVLLDQRMRRLEAPR